MSLLFIGQPFGGSGLILAIVGGSEMAPKRRQENLLRR